MSIKYNNNLVFNKRLDQMKNQNHLNKLTTITNEYLCNSIKTNLLVYKE